MLTIISALRRRVRTGEPAKPTGPTRDNAALDHAGGAAADDVMAVSWLGEDGERRD